MIRLLENPFHPDEVLLKEFLVSGKIPGTEAWVDESTPERTDQREA